MFAYDFIVRSIVEDFNKEVVNGVKLVMCFFKQYIVYMHPLFPGGLILECIAQGQELV